MRMSWVLVVPLTVLGFANLSPGQDAKQQREEYFRNAGQWSYPHKLDGNEVRIDPSIGGSQLWLKVVKEHEAKVSQFQEQVNKAKRGEYRSERKIEYVDTDGRTRERIIVEDQNAVMLALSQNALLIAQGQPPDIAYFAAKQKEYVQYQLARREYWRTVLPDVPAKFAGPAVQKPIVSLRYDPSYKSQADEEFWAKYFVKNVSGKELHNVTLVVKLYHFSTDEATAHQVYFLSRWKPNTELELSHEFVPNDDNPAIRYRVPKLLMSNQPPSAELDGIAGVLRMDLVVWCDEFRQPAQTTKLPQRVEKVMTELLAIAEDRLRQGHLLGLPIPASQRPTTQRQSRLANAPKPKAKDVKVWLQRYKEEHLAPLVLPILQHGDPKSPEFAKALKYLDDPVAAHAALQTPQ